MKHEKRLPYLLASNVLNTQQATTIRDWTIAHEKLLNEIGDLKESIEVNIHVSLAKDYE